MTDNEIINELNLRIDNFSRETLDLIKRLKMKNKELDERNVIYRGTVEWQAKEIKRQKAENERLEKNYEELIYKTECLLCHATGNKFSKHTYTTQEMISFVDDYIQDCCDEAVEEAKEAVKSEAIKEFAKELKNCFAISGDYLDIINIIDNLVKEMTEKKNDFIKKRSV